MIREAPTSREEKVLAVARVVKPHGIKGAVVVEVLSDFPERFSPGEKLDMGVGEAAFETLSIETSSVQGDSAVVKFSGIDDRDGAERLRNRFLYIKEEDAFPLDEGEYWIHDLDGLTVVNDAGDKMGVVTDVICGSAQDLLSITGAWGEEFQIPFVKAFIKDVDLENGKLTVKLIEGMIL